MNLTLKIDVPDENGAVIEQIDDLDQRLAWFLNEQAALERWRAERQPSDDRQLAAAIIERAEEMKRGGVNRTEVSERFLKRWDEMMSSIAE